MEVQGPSDTHSEFITRPVPGYLYSTTHHHIIDMIPSSEASIYTSTQDTHFDTPNGARLPVSQASNGSNSRNSSLMRQEDTGRLWRSPLNSGLWICIELVLTVCQIVASVVVLSLSRHEHPQAPWFEWIAGYASGCVATLPILYWRYYHDGNQVQEHHSSMIPRSNQASWLMNTRRLKVLMEYFKIFVDCFFAGWFVVGNVWIFGRHSSANEAPNLYRLCIVFLTLKCIGYVMPFIFCAICCCLPCLISILGSREDVMQTKGATSESINALPTYKFKMKKNKSRYENSSITGEDGIVAAGTEKERFISGEDAVCCICLGKYENNDELRELPCSHLFHKDCIDMWLKINALCPFCKGGIGKNKSGTDSGEDASQRQRESRANNGFIAI